LHRSGHGAVRTDHRTSDEEIPGMTSIPWPTHAQRGRAVATAPTEPVADTDVAEAWQTLADAAPRYPHAPDGEQMDAPTWRAALLAAHPACAADFETKARGDPVMSGSVIVAGARTPMGLLFGSLKDFTGADLGGSAIKAAIERAGITPDQVEYVVMGQAIQAGGGQNATCQASTKGGVPMQVPALTINKVCLSGLDAIALADQLIRAGEFEIVVAGGMESMTNAPHLLLGISGARVVLHLALELKRRGGGMGAAALCGGGGQGDTLIVRVPKT
jgi:Thiolase, N-terminal domain